ncbi:helix-turn-helix domain-containing protein [Periweissella cryptocerci]|uniref:Helix-turn-helix domain-containing protein n=1 Tax=Periweissella cryptocerci TaxID=2506420 RepID=A0A4P6YTZ3_9LACO|nr:helix-turn-helix transcriptional regulator [Periweissella cryptocerci]QBO36238.1 helix-turn-helix domain-containing protein [Periweissella cryptocerci]
MKFNEIVKIKRQKLKLTQDQLAGKVLVSSKTVSNWETGKTIPDLESAIRLAGLFGTSLDELLLNKSDNDSVEISTEKWKYKGENIFENIAHFFDNIAIIYLTVDKSRSPKKDELLHQELTAFNEWRIKFNREISFSLYGVLTKQEKNLRDSFMDILYNIYDVEYTLYPLQWENKGLYLASTKNGNFDYVGLNNFGGNASQKIEAVRKYLDRLEREQSKERCTITAYRDEIVKDLIDQIQQEYNLAIATNVFDDLEPYVLQHTYHQFFYQQSTELVARQEQVITEMKKRLTEANQNIMKFSQKLNEADVEMVKDLEYLEKRRNFIQKQIELLIANQASLILLNGNSLSDMTEFIKINQLHDREIIKKLTEAERLMKVYWAEVTDYDIAVVI